MTTRRNERGLGRVLQTALVAVAVAAVGAVSYGTAAAVSSWLPADPATYAAGVHSTTPADQFQSISCPTTGECVAVGWTEDVNGYSRAFAQTMSGGVWSDAELTTFDTGIESATPSSVLNGVSCVSAGECTAVGSFKNAGGATVAFTQTMTGGAWALGRPTTFPGSVTGATRSALTAVSCTAVGECTASGGISYTYPVKRAFTVTQASGAWGDADVVVFGAGVENASPVTDSLGVSCSSAGNCVVTGQFLRVSGGKTAFVRVMSSGSWADAIPVAFPVAIPVSYGAYKAAYGEGVSCGADGSCTVIGYANDDNGDTRAFAWSMSSGVWESTAVLSTFAAGAEDAYPNENLLSVSCASAGNCTAVGYYADAASHYQAFAQTMTSGVWGTAVTMSFDAGVQHVASPDAELYAVDCVSAGNCVGVGIVKDTAGNYQSFTATMVSGVWETGMVTTFTAGVQHTAPLDQLVSVSCPAIDECVAAGKFKNAGGYGEAFTYSMGVVPPAPTVTSTAPASGLTTGGQSITITGTGFLPGATVTIGGLACSSVVVVDDTTITCSVPAGTVGAADVEVCNADTQCGSQASGFTYVLPEPPLPPTGSGTSTMVIVALGLVVVGGALVSVRRRTA